MGKRVRLAGSNPIRGRANGRGRARATGRSRAAEKEKAQIKPFRFVVPENDPILASGDFEEAERKYEERLMDGDEEGGGARTVAEEQYDGNDEGELDEEQIREIEKELVAEEEGDRSRSKPPAAKQRKQRQQVDALPEDVLAGIDDALTTEKKMKRSAIAQKELARMKERMVARREAAAAEASPYAGRERRIGHYRIVKLKQ